MPEATTPLILLIGSGCFGAILGWLIYYTNRYRKGAPQFSDLVTIVGIIGGGAVLKLFPAGTDIFGAYGIGLAIGFFLYFITLIIFVNVTKFPYAWFLDGRRRKINSDEEKAPYEHEQYTMVK